MAMSRKEMYDTMAKSIAKPTKRVELKPSSNGNPESRKFYRPIEKKGGK